MYCGYKFFALIVVGNTLIDYVFLLFADHKFSLSLDKSTWEYTYKPLSFVVVTSKGTLDIDLNTASSFPDYMISRFLENLLRITLS